MFPCQPWRLVARAGRDLFALWNGGKNYVAFATIQCPFAIKQHDFAESRRRTVPLPGKRQLLKRLREILNKMNRYAQTVEHLERSDGDSGRRRALAARLDTALKRAGVSSARVAKWVDVSESDVFWRRGITVPPMLAFRRIAASLNVEMHWLCTGHTLASAG